MATYARVVSGIVQETFAVPSGFTISQCFNPGIPGQWAECDQTAGVAYGWTHDGATFHAPSIT